MNTIEVCEHLLYKIPELRESFYNLGILSQGRNIQPKYHEEFEHILDKFSNPKIVSVVGPIQVTYIIEPTDPIRRKYHTIEITGFNCKKMEISKSGFSTYFSSILNIRDFIPQPLVKKLIYFKDPKQLEGIIFSEYETGKWTIGDPLEIIPKQIINASLKRIMAEIMDDLI